MRPKLSVIAREAGVSVSTVSKALNGKSDVSPHTRKLIAKVLERRGYVPRPAHYRRGSMLDIVLQCLTSPYSLAILSGVEEAAWRAGVDIVVSAVVDRTRYHQPPSVWLDRISTRDSAGVLLARTSLTSAQRAWLIDHDIPMVIIDPLGKVPAGVTVVSSANQLGARAATEHLISLGHSRIAVVTGRPGVPAARERLAGFQQAMTEAGLRTDPRWQVCGYFRTEPAAEAVRDLLTQLPEPPTAFFACSDGMALGIYQALAEHGLRVPHDVSVVGFDDSVVATSVTPFLTTVRQPWPDLGAAALMALLSKDPPARIELPAELVLRDSTAPPALG
ncbi:LacI family DNA-binding transcriptional regulator [Nonomuraea sp. 3N208]|uniref:LacI family DNA-binding transcriptional regulator n=1 Tax=unclassified Nonomuraea TaxID=2593643 RepID=UPI00273A9613|nr:LacI family DNA-binding transcriptional regulator [Nonomuraea sp. G32]MDP4502671.1 LacI family DNA-binding transcriptional regulator [Nonomuraea sp. G32]